MEKIEFAVFNGHNFDDYKIIESDMTHLIRDMGKSLDLDVADLPWTSRFPAVTDITKDYKKNYVIVPSIRTSMYDTIKATSEKFIVFICNKSGFLPLNENDIRYFKDHLYE